jgi:predicted MarR family transcription regulator
LNTEFLLWVLEQCRDGCSFNDKNYPKEFNAKLKYALNKLLEDEHIKEISEAKDGAKCYIITALGITALRHKRILDI